MAQYGHFLLLTGFWKKRKVREPKNPQSRYSVAYSLFEVVFLTGITTSHNRRYTKLPRPWVFAS